MLVGFGISLYAGVDPPQDPVFKTNPTQIVEPIVIDTCALNNNHKIVELIGGYCLLLGTLNNVTSFIIQRQVYVIAPDFTISMYGSSCK